MKLHDAWRGLSRCGWRRVASSNFERHNKSWWCPTKKKRTATLEELERFLGLTRILREDILSREEYDLRFEPRLNAIRMTFYRRMEKEEE